jgi:hypothetical protein
MLVFVADCPLGLVGTNGQGGEHGAAVFEGSRSLYLCSR